MSLGYGYAKASRFALDSLCADLYEEIWRTSATSHFRLSQGECWTILCCLVFPAA